MAKTKRKKGKSKRQKGGIFGLLPMLFGRLMGSRQQVRNSPMGAASPRVGRPRRTVKRR